MIKREDCTQNDMVIDGIEVSTWYSAGAEPDWHAINMTKAREVTGESTNSMAELSAGWARRLDDTGCTGYGDTELLAIIHLFSRLDVDKDQLSLFERIDNPIQVKYK